MGMGWLDNGRTGSAKDRRRITAKLDLIDENLDTGDDDALQDRAFTGGAFGKQLKTELEAVGNDPLLLADAHDNAVHRPLTRYVDGDGHDAFRKP